MTPEERRTPLEELAEIEREVERIVLAFDAGDSRRDDIRALAARLAAARGATSETLIQIADRLEQIGERVRGVTEGFDNRDPSAFLGNNVLYEAAEVRKLARHGGAGPTEER